MIKTLSALITASSAMIFGLIAPGAPAEPTQAEPQNEVVAVNFTKEIKPILDKYCIGCHNARRPKARLDLTSKKGIEKGGSHGVVINKKTPEKSLLLIRMKGQNNSKIMPPGGKLKATEINKIEQWIKEGAKF